MFSLKEDPWSLRVSKVLNSFNNTGNNLLNYNVLIKLL